MKNTCKNHVCNRTTHCEFFRILLVSRQTECIGMFVQVSDSVVNFFVRIDRAVTSNFELSFEHYRLELRNIFASLPFLGSNQLRDLAANCSLLSPRAIGRSQGGILNSGCWPSSLSLNAWEDLEWAIFGLLCLLEVVMNDLFWMKTGRSFPSATPIFSCRRGRLQLKAAINLKGSAGAPQIKPSRLAHFSNSPWPTYIDFPLWEGRAVRREVSGWPRSTFTWHCGADSWWRWR